MKKRKVGVMGENYGVVDKIPLGCGRTLRVENDDWGYFITVADKELNRLYLSKLIINKEDLEDEISTVKELFK